MTNGTFTVPIPCNEPVYGYLPKSPERAAIKAELDRQYNTHITIPLIIGGEEIYTDTRVDITMPSDHGHVLAQCCLAGEKELMMAVECALDAKKAWEEAPFEHRAAIFLKAAALVSGPYRYRLNAATMLGQGKTLQQAEIDSACELTDFLRHNVSYAAEIYSKQPESGACEWNRLDYRPLEGFVLAITPFNFTAIGGNLPTAPAIMGNTVVWKPATVATLSNYYFMKVLMEAGLPAGVINFVPCKGSDASRYVVAHPSLAGFHFTGSTAVFRSVWGEVGRNIASYRTYPRLIGETGGKDFVFAHPSADVRALTAALIRGAFEYQGQKCSAASRAYIPKSLWEETRALLLDGINTLKVGDVRDLTSFMSAVIDRAAFDSIASYIDHAKASPDAEVLCGGYDGSHGYFVYPTVIVAKRPDYKSMTEEIFGPVLTVYVYDDDKLDETLKECDTASPYALTGAVFARDRDAIIHIEAMLRHAAGNFYINDKPTGAVVGRQPFGGARASGTNDKAGSALNLYRWTSPRAIKEAFISPCETLYPHMTED